MQEQIQFSKKTALQYIQAGKYRQARAILQNIAMQDDEALAMLQRLNTIEATPAPRKRNPIITILALMGAIALVCIVAVVFLPEIELPQSTSNTITSRTLIADLIKTELAAQDYTVSSVQFDGGELVIRASGIDATDQARTLGGIIGVSVGIIDSPNVKIDQPLFMRVTFTGSPSMSFSYRSAQQLARGDITAAQFLLTAGN